MTTRPLSPDVEARNAQAKLLWLDAVSNGLSQFEIAEKFEMSVGWLQGLARREKWGAWPVARSSFGLTRAIDRRMYGALADDVVMLRDHGGLHVAHFHGDYRVGTEVLTEEQLRARAAALRARRGTVPAAGQAVTPSHQPKGQEHGETTQQAARTRGYLAIQ